MLLSNLPCMHIRQKMLRVLRRIGQACFEKHTVLQCSSLKPAPLITQIGLEVITTLRYLSRDDRNLSSEFLALPDPIEMEVSLFENHHRNYNQQNKSQSVIVFLHLSN